MGNKKGKIAVLSDWCRGPYQEKLFMGILAAAETYDKKCFFFAGRKLKAPDTEDLQQNRIYQLIRPDDYDGIILTGLLADYCSQKEFYDFALPFKKVPLVSVEYKLPDISAVLCDDQSSISQLIAHMVLDHQCEKWIILTGPRDNYCSQNRLSIVREQLKKHNIVLKPASIMQGDYSYISGRTSVKKLLNELKKDFQKKVDVIMAFNDLMALGIIDELKENKIRVPQDVAVTGFDDLDDASTNVPGITTIGQPIYDIGYSAVRSLAIDKASTNQDLFLNSKLIIRESCGCFKQGIEKNSDALKINDSEAIEPATSCEQESFEKMKSSFSEYFIYQLIYVSDALKKVLNITELSQWMHKGFSSLGISECYMFFYSKSIEPTNQLAFGYGPQGIFSNQEIADFNNSDFTFITTADESDGHFCCLPLLFDEEHYGFLLMTMKISSWLAYETLRAQVSSSLKNIYLLDQVGHMNKKLIDMNQKLKKTEEQKTRFFINMAHETRTPLTLIKNHLDKYTQEKPEDQDLNIIKTNINHLLQNMINFLDAEKIQKGKILYNHNQVVDLSELVFAKKKLYSQARAGSFQPIEWEVESDCFIQADPWAIDRVLNNLLDNAIKYNQDHQVIKLKLKKDGGKIQLTVADKGVGMAPQVMEHIFRPYYQISSSHFSQGIGMGLYIVKSIIDEIGAKIEVQSEMDKGSLFQVEFLQSDVRTDQRCEYAVSLPDSFAMESPKLNSALGPNTAEAPKILIVDDNRQLLSFLQKSLSRDFYVVVEVDSRKVIERLNSMDLPDLIISDVMMPFLDGHELVNQIYSIEKYSSIPVIFLTARDSEPERIASYSQGVIDYIQKPFSIVSLTSKIKALLRLEKTREKNKAKEVKRRILSVLNENVADEAVQSQANFDSLCLGYRLSQREKEVLLEVVKGANNKQIASDLNISLRTVEFHISNLFKKCHCVDRFQLLKIFQGSIR